jgi:predicted thioredoxin/glutaredoxin
MIFPTVDDCAGLRGVTRDLLHEFDHLLRDALVATRHRARQLDLADEEVETACVTVMMSVVAGAVLAAAQSPADVSDAKFAAIARDALAWAKQRVGDTSERRH